LHINADFAEYTAFSINGSCDANLFAYCLNNPIVAQDDTGEWLHILIGAVVGAAVSTVTAAIEGKSGAEIAAGAGALSGALASTGLGVVAQVAGAAVISAAESALSQGATKGFDKIDVKEVAFDACIGGVSAIGNGVGKGVAKQLKTLGKQTVKRVANAWGKKGIRTACRVAVKAGAYYVKQAGTSFLKPRNYSVLRYKSS